MTPAILIAAALTVSPSTFYSGLDETPTIPPSVFYSGLPEEPQPEPAAAKPDTRPLVTLYSSPGCAPCEKAKKLAEAGIMPEVRFVVVRDKPDWVDLTPLLHYQNAKGESKIFRLHQYEPAAGFAEFRRTVLPYLVPSSAADVGQAPTPIAEVRRVLSLLRPQPHETFVDYGCGDGRWLIEAVRTYGCRAVGVEIDPQQVDRARRAVDEAGLVGRVQIIEGDVLTANVEAQVGVAYLYPDLLARLRPKLLKLDRFATPYHPVDGVQMQQSGDAWIWQKPQPVQQQQAYAVYGGQMYTGRVCSNPNCAMCNAIQRQLEASRVVVRETRRMVLKLVPCRTCPSGYRQVWVLE